MTVGLGHFPRLSSGSVWHFMSEHDLHYGNK